MTSLSDGALSPVGGYYLIRGETDPDDVIVESNETDNVSYALIHVKGETVEV